ncbi:MAG: SNF2-related protein [Bryobacterales bacterium]|nr:SNF2-related protein [Bryobacterales bacterium]
MIDPRQHQAQERLWEKYKALDSESQRALELLSVVYRPVHKIRAVNYLQSAKIGGDHKFPTAEARVTRLVDGLRRRGLLVRRDFEIACDARIVDWVTREAERCGRLQEAVEAVERFEQGESGTYSTRKQFGYWDTFELIADLRATVFLNESEKFMQVLDKGRTYGDHMEAAVGALIEICGNSRDTDWFAARHPTIRRTVLAPLIAGAHGRLAPVETHVQMLRDLAGHEGHDDTDTALLVVHELLCGRLDHLKSLRFREPNMVGSMYSGWERCVRGDYSGAVEEFDRSLKALKKASRRRQVDLPTDLAVFYIHALLAAGEGGGTGRAQKYLQAAKLRDWESPHLRDLQLSVVDFVDGKGWRGLESSDMLDELPLLLPVQQIYAYAALCWGDIRTARQFRPKISDLRKRASEHGYAWVAAEASSLLARLSGDGSQIASAHQDHRRIGTVSVLDGLVEQEPWERSLVALERMRERIAVGGRAPAGESRLTWRIDLSAPQHSRVQPFEQRLGKTGRWSAGRSVALKRLFERNGVDYLSEQDNQVCKAISLDQYGVFGGRGGHYINDTKALQALVGHPFVFRADAPKTALEIVRHEPQLRVATAGSEVRVEIVPEPPDAGSVLVTDEGGNRLSVTSFEDRHREIHAVLGAGGLVVPERSKDRVAKAILSVSDLVTVHSDIEGAAGGAETVASDPTPEFHLTPLDSGLRVEAYVRPCSEEGPAFTPGEGGTEVYATVAGKRSRASRDLAEETIRYKVAVASCPTLQQAAWDRSGWTLPDPLECLELVDELKGLGDAVKVAWPKGETLRVPHRATSDHFSLKIRQRHDWFSIDGKLELESGLVLSLRELLDHMENVSGRFVRLGEKDFVALSERFRRHVEELAAYVDRHGKGMRFHSTRAHALEGLVGDAGAVDADAAWSNRLRQFQEALALDPKLPSTIQAELREYQAEGYRWAARLATWGAGACLADDMGLGKTLQALTVAVARAPQGPTLVVAPTSVCPNWIDEARRFAPTLRPTMLGPGDRAKKLQAAGPFDLIISSYGLLHQEVDLLAEVNWETVVLDEAQAIKNRLTMRSRAAMRLKGRFKMITTGTPVENHLGELWNLFQFINPGLLGSTDSFSEKFGTPIHQHSDAEARQRLKRLIQPFILRRTKSAVLEELPARTEITIKVAMKEDERALYEAVRMRAVEALHDVSPDEEAKSHIKILAQWGYALDSGNHYM